MVPRPTGSRRANLPFIGHCDGHPVPTATRSVKGFRDHRRLRQMRFSGPTATTSASGATRAILSSHTSPVNSAFRAHRVSAVVPSLDLPRL